MREELAPHVDVGGDQAADQRRQRVIGHGEQDEIGGEGVDAVDGTLGRHVALKILNRQYSKSAERIAQFEKEAQLTAAVTSRAGRSGSRG